MKHKVDIEKIKQQLLKEKEKRAAEMVERFSRLKPFETVDDIPDIPKVNDPRIYEEVIVKTSSDVEQYQRINLKWVLPMKVIVATLNEPSGTERFSGVSVTSLESGKKTILITFKMIMDMICLSQ